MVIKHTIGICAFLSFIVIFFVGSSKIISQQSTNYPDGVYAELYTTKGIIVLQLEFEKTPMTTANFVGLAEGTIKNAAFPEGRPFYNGSPFHRVVPGHVIQTGSAVGGSSSGSGYTFPNEIYPGLSHNKAGVLGMANSGPHTNSSQFYITLGDRSYLDGDYTVFGQVIAGMNVVMSIVQGDSVKSIKIVRIGKKAEQFKPDTDSFNRMVESAKLRVKETEEKKKRDEEALIAKNWPNAQTAENGVKYVILKSGTGEKPTAGAILIVRYTGKLLDGRVFCSSTDGKPAQEDTAAVFQYEIGKNRVNSGFDSAVRDMKSGEKRLIIVPSNLAYGTSGFYGQEKQGEKRFVFSPNTTLIYEIELLGFKK